MDEGSFSSPKKRVAETIKTNERNAAKFEEQVAENKSGISSIEHNISLKQEPLETKEQETAELQRKEDEITGIRRTLRILKGGGKRVEEEKADREYEISNIKKSIDSKQKAIKNLEEDVQKTQKKAKHAETVAEANKRNISKETEGKKPWPERVVTQETSPKMRSALERQDDLSTKGINEKISFYKEHGYEAENPTYLFSKRVVTELTDEHVEIEKGRVLDGFIKDLEDDENKVRQLEKKDPYNQLTKAKERAEETKTRIESYRKRCQKDAEAIIVGITPFYEQLMKYAEENEISLSENTLLKLIKGGMNIQSHSGYEFMKRHGGTSESWYEKGGSYLSNFFKEHRIPEKDRVPYIMAFAAGVSSQEGIILQASTFRYWLIESFPVDQVDSVWDTSERNWIKVERPQTPLGFGHYCSRGNSEKAWGRQYVDESEAGAIEQANSIVLDTYDAMISRGQTKMAKHFGRGAGFNNLGGRPQFPELKIAESE